MQDKPGVDWQAIRAAVENGATYRAAAEPYDITPQAIAKRAKREKWAKNGHQGAPSTLPRRPRWRQLIKKTPLAIADPQCHNGYPVIDRAKTAVQILEAITDGTPEVHAAAAAGISADTWHNWKKNYIEIAELARRAKGYLARRRVASIQNASDGGDWRAASYLLERDPATREDFSKPDDRNAPVQIILNMPRGDFSDVKVIEGQTVEETD